MDNMFIFNVKSENMWKKLPILEVVHVEEYVDFIIIIKNHGGMGTVSIGLMAYEKDDSAVILAMKRIKENKINDIKQFKKEANLWISLKHPNIVKALIFVEISDEFCLFMEPVLPNKNGQTNLNDYLSENITLKQILDWSIQFCYAMIYLQSNGVAIHRDIKPQNILISNNLLKITDFGIANSLNIEKNYAQRLSGTFEYQAPETFLGKYDVKSDIYSWGIVLYQMVMKGDYPFVITNEVFKTYNDEVQYYQNLHENYIVPIIESPLKNIIYKCLQKDSTKRYKDFKELLCDFKNIYIEFFGNDIYEPKLEDFTVTEEILRVNSLHNLGKDQEAWNLLNSIQENEESRPLLSVTYNQLGDTKKSLECYKKEVLDKPLNYESRYGYATRLHEMGDYFEAEVEYNLTLKIKPNDKKTLVNLGNLMRDMGSYEESLEYYEKVLKIDSDFFMAKINKAITFINMKKFDESQSIVDKLELDKRYTKKYKIKIAEETMRVNEAKGSFLFYKLKREYPEDEQILFEIVHFHIKHQRYHASIDELYNILKINPENNEAKHLMAINYGMLADQEANNENWDKSLENINKSLEYEDIEISWIKKLLILLVKLLFSKEDVFEELKETVENIKKRKNVIEFIKKDIKNFSEVKNGEQLLLDFINLF